MRSNTAVIDVIERAHDSTPFCACGSHTTPVWRDGVVWVECASLGQPAEGWVRRLVAIVTSPVHTRTRVVEVPAANQAATTS